MYKLRISLVLLLALAPLSDGMAKIYKWVDEDGQVQYSSSPPPKGKVETIKVEKPPVSPEQRDWEMQKLRDKAGFGPKEEGEQETPAPTAAPEDPAFNKLACENARKNLQTIAANPRIKSKDKDGNDLYLDDTQIAAERQKAQDQVNQYCK